MRAGSDVGALSFLSPNAITVTDQPIRAFPVERGPHIGRHVAKPTVCFRQRLQVRLRVLLAPARE
jgi:hypothetical protein